MQSVLAWLMSVMTALAPGFGGVPAEPVFFGYVEGDYLYMASRHAGTIAEVAVDDGQPVKAGDLLFRMDRDRERQALAAAKARLEAARSNWSDKTKGDRREEIAVVEARLRSAEADLELARLNYKRATNLIKCRVVSESRRDQDRTAVQTGEARVRQLKAELEVARLPKRAAQVEAARQEMLAADADVRKAQVDLEDRSVRAPATGRVERVFLRAGEHAGAGASVVSILPPGNLKIRFYVSEPARPRLALGARVRVNCTGCAKPVAAKVTFLASEAEHTPPVIYSLEERAKLVFLVEAKPEAPATLAPGQPVDVRLAK
ncbi:MAG: HlyD family secretion protein [Methyloligellaceae bacterium]